MTPFTIEINSPVIDTPTLKTKLLNFLTTIYLILCQCIGHVLNAAAIAMRGGIVLPLHQIWTRFNPQVAFGEAGIIMPHSSLTFIINTLLALVAIKTQCLPGFPFQTHPHIVILSVTCIMMYCLASVVELIVLAVGLDRASVYAIIAHLGKTGSLCTLVASLASLLCM
ncbi:hypothetical protein E3N88_08139 [Mikania micrantha]|uniref:Uncharacterized protein n=1 Tax=Mikania micrantha TaxID=192012 RepID=A0A5N6PFI1_9ASTR|nr:hypothetical protein E3N88_08139 [Mikania micrantha]